MKEAIALFDKTLVLCKNVMELGHIFGLRNAAKTQITVMERLGPDLIKKMSMS